MTELAIALLMIVHGEIKEARLQTSEWNVEDTSKWKTEDTDNFFYEIEEKKHD